MNLKQQKMHSFLPDFCGVHTLFVVILLGELLAIVLTLNFVAHTRNHFVVLAMYSLFIQWIALFCVAALCFAKDSLNRLTDFWVASLSYLLILLISLTITELTWWIFYVKLALPYLIVTKHEVFLLRCMGTSAIVGALALRYFYVKHQWQKNIESEANAKLQALQSRIRPHFLFNCMNTIASLTRKDPILAEQTTEDLADLFRVYTQETKRMSTVSEEILLCQRYLRVESSRLGDRLQVIWETDNLPSTLQLPTLTLQPILENAIYHGIELLPEGGKIHIQSEIMTNKIIITITNPSPLNNNTEHQGNQMALENIRQRLAIHYGSQGLLLTKCDEQLYTTNIILPYPHENTDS